MTTESKIEEKCLNLLSQPNNPEASMMYDSRLETKLASSKAANTYRQKHPDVFCNFFTFLIFFIHMHGLQYKWFLQSIFTAVPFLLH